MYQGDGENGAGGVSGICSAEMASVDAMRQDGKKMKKLERKTANKERQKALRTCRKNACASQKQEVKKAQKLAKTCYAEVKAAFKSYNEKRKAERAEWKKKRAERRKQKQKRKTPVISGDK